MLQPLTKSHSKDDYQSWLVGFTILFVIFVKCYMMCVHPSMQRAYQRQSQQTERQSQVIFDYPNIEIPLIEK